MQPVAQRRARLPVQGRAGGQPDRAGHDRLGPERGVAPPAAPAVPGRGQDPLHPGEARLQLGLQGVQELAGHGLGRGEEAPRLLPGGRARHLVLGQPLRHGRLHRPGGQDPAHRPQLRGAPQVQEGLELE